MLYELNQPRPRLTRKSDFNISTFTTPAQHNKTFNSRALLEYNVQ